MMTESQLARRLECSVQLVRYHRKNHANAPALDDLDGWKEWMAAHQRVRSEKSDVADRISKKKLAIYEFKRREAKRKDLEANEKLLAADKVKRKLSELMSFFFGELDRLAQEYPMTLVGKKEVEINEECVRQTKLIKRTLEDKLGGGVDASR